MQVFCPTRLEHPPWSLKILDDDSGVDGIQDGVVVVVAFSSLARIWGECSTIHSPSAFFFFFFKVEISWRTLISLFGPGSVHSGSVS